jgi:hypothetical protein
MARTNRRRRHRLTPILHDLGVVESVRGRERADVRWERLVRDTQEEEFLKYLKRNGMSARRLEKRLKQKKNLSKPVIFIPETKKQHPTILDITSTVFKNQYLKPGSLEIFTGVGFGVVVREAK